MSGNSWKKIKKIALPSIGWVIKEQTVGQLWPHHTHDIDQLVWELLLHLWLNATDDANNPSIIKEATKHWIAKIIWHSTQDLWEYLSVIHKPITSIPYQKVMHHLQEHHAFTSVALWSVLACVITEQVIKYHQRKSLNNIWSNGLLKE